MPSSTAGETPAATLRFSYASLFPSTGTVQRTGSVLTGSEAHHAVRVLRIRKKEQVTVLDGAGSEMQCLVEGYDRDKVQLSVIEKKFVVPLPYQITLLQALPKGKIFDSIIQKATELGTFRIVPLLTER